MLNTLFKQLNVLFNSFSFYFLILFFVYLVFTNFHISLLYFLTANFVVSTFSACWGSFFLVYIYIYFFCIFFFFFKATNKNFLYLQFYNLYFYLTHFSFVEFLWFTFLNLKQILNFFISFFKSSFVFFAFTNFFLSLFSIITWKPLFKRASYYGYFRSTRTYWLND